MTGDFLKTNVRQTSRQWFGSRFTEKLPGALLAAILAFFCSSLPVSAQLQPGQPSVEASLRSPQAAVGQAVPFTITVSGGAADAVPKVPQVDGLDIQAAGQQMRTEVNNFNISTKITYTYLVTPQREGKFEIPSVDVRISGRTYRTPPLELTAAAAGAPGTAGSTRLIWGEVRLGKNDVYVGERVPVEFTFYFDNRIRFGIDSLARFEADGFTFDKLGEPTQQSGLFNGQDVTVLTYRTTIVPAKAGKLSIGPVEQAARVQAPRQTRPRRSPRSVDPFNPDDFDDFFKSIFDDPVIGMAPVQPALVKAPAVELNVRPLPKSHAPASFAGAVGKFEMKTTAEPLRMKTGDPVTLSLEITGEGTFEGFDKPLLQNKDGWRDYPPTARFIPDGRSTHSGTQRVELVLTPMQPVRNLPVAEFSYFDPETGQYKTLKSEPLPVEILDAPAPVPTPADAAAPAPTSAPQGTSQPGSPAPAPQASPGDILYLTLDTPEFAPLPSPIERDSRYLAANALAGAAVLGLAGYLWASARAPSTGALRRREVRVAAHALEHLSSAPLSAPQFYEQAAALLKHVERGRFDRRMPDELVVQCREVLARRDELMFSGSMLDSGRVDAEERNRVLATLRAVQKEGALSA